MKKRYKIIFICVACILMFGVSFAIAYAFLISNDTAVNDFTIGETNIEINEEFEPPEELLPGVSFTKKPCVQNTGNLPSYIRVRADFSDNRAKAFCEDLDIDTENWMYDTTDGYYYYKYLVQPNNSTTPLFTTVKIKDDTPKADIISFDILIYAESVQHKDHEGACADNEYQTAFNSYEDKDA